MLRRTTRKSLIYKERYKIIMFPAYETVKKVGEAKQGSKSNLYHTRFGVIYPFLVETL